MSPPGDYLHRFGESGDVRDAASGAWHNSAARALRIRRPPATAADLLLDGFAARLTEGYAAGAPLLRAAITRLRVEELPWDRSRRWMALGCVAARELLDDEALDALARRWMPQLRR